MSSAFDILFIVKTGDRVRIVDTKSQTEVTGKIYVEDDEIYARNEWESVKLEWDQKHPSIAFVGATVFGPCRVIVTGGDGLCLNCKSRHSNATFCPNCGTKLLS